MASQLALLFLYLRVLSNKFSQITLIEQKHIITSLQDLRNLREINTNSTNQNEEPK